MKGLASEGRTVFLSSHLMSEMAQTEGGAARRTVQAGGGRDLTGRHRAAVLERGQDRGLGRVRRNPRPGGGSG
jgi:hypothetical protein